MSELIGRCPEGKKVLRVKACLQFAFLRYARISVFLHQGIVSPPPGALKLRHPGVSGCSLRGAILGKVGTHFEHVLMHFQACTIGF